MVYLVEKDYRNTWNEIVFYKGERVESVEVDGMTFFRRFGTDDTPQMVYPGYLKAEPADTCDHNFTVSCPEGCN